MAWLPAALDDGGAGASAHTDDSTILPPDLADRANHELLVRDSELH